MIPETTLPNTYLPARERSPEIDFRYSDNRLTMRGEAYPEDAASFFGPLLKEVAAHCAATQGQALTAEFQLIYFNTSSAKALMNLIQILEKAGLGGTQVHIRWLIQKDDDVMREFGEDFASELKHVQFQLLEL